MKKYIDLQEFVNLGLLHEVNRRFFHPIGLAMEINIDENGEYVISGFLDARSDPEGFVIGAIESPKVTRPEAANTYENMVKAGSRQVRFGWVVQPTQDMLPPTSFTVVQTKQLPASLGPHPEGHPKA